MTVLAAVRPDPSPCAEAAHEGCAACPVRQDALCAALEMPEELDTMHRLGRRVQVSRGQTVVWEGDESLVVGNVIDGLLKLSIVNANGTEQIVGLAYPSDFIGRPFGAQSGQSVTALVDSTVCIFPRRAFDAFAESHPHLSQALLRRTLDDLDRARQWMMLLARKSASARVASLLLDIWQRSRVTKDRAVRLPLSRQQMGDLLGLVIETVSRSITALREQGVVSLPGGRGLIVEDPAALRAIAGD